MERRNKKVKTAGNRRRLIILFRDFEMLDISICNKWQKKNNETKEK